jgi:hypothetical protein
MTAGSAIYLIGTGTATQANSKITNVGFTNVFNPVLILRPSWPVISGCYFDTWGSSAIYLYTSAGIEGAGGHIHDNYFFGTSATTTSPIYSEVGYTDIHDNEILGGPNSVYFNIKNNPAGYIKVHDNTIENFATSGVEVASGDGSVATMLMIQHNEFSDNANTPTASIFVVDSTTTPAWINDVIISGNISRNTTAVGARHIWVGAGKNVIVAQNVMDELGTNSPGGIYIGGAATNAGLIAPIQVLDNTFIGTFGNKYSVAGGTPVIRDTVTGFTVATLPTNLGNGSQFFTTDGTPATACTASGTGSMAFRQNGAWKCF